MSLSKKLFLALLPLFLLFIGVFTLVQIKYIYPVFAELEKQFALKNYERVISRFREELESLERMNRDWAAWDDTYEYIQGKRPNYEASNLVAASFMNGGFDFMFFLDAQANLVWHGVYDGAHDEIVKDELLAKKVMKQLLLRHGVDHSSFRMEECHKGILFIDSKPVFFSMQPILTSDEQGPVMGGLIRGEFLDSGPISSYLNQSGIRFEITPVYDNHLLASPDVQLDILDDHTLRLSRYIFSHGEPVVLIDSYYPRNISLQGKVAVKTALIASVVLGVIFLMVQWYVLQFLVILPLSKLKSAAISVARDKGYVQPDIVEDKNEISALSQQLSSMLDAIEVREEQLQQALKKLEHLSVTDSLTKLANRLKFDDVSTQEWLRARRDCRPLSIIMCDVDYFKQYNDHYGHIVGDDCLVEIAAILNASVSRPTDLVARYGGEEFVILLPNTDVKGAEFIANKITQKLAQLNITHISSKVSNHITMSMGIASAVPDTERSLRQLISCADSALYEAKLSGRNCYKVS